MGDVKYKLVKDNKDVDEEDLWDLFIVDESEEYYDTFTSYKDAIKCMKALVSEDETQLFDAWGKRINWGIL